ncbi:hypothetical protein JZ751_025554 [Albula glossodonta]|uniref:Uncharacterized protein n=1 Tax=Albula glossodonta TaxID=121402 RepID=A0A8T2NI14_9TELE|nr:hypothetical protein JZ751_025554 [Albula glossodonta]
MDSSLVAPPTKDQTSNHGPFPTPSRINGANQSPTPGSGHKGRSKARENWQLKTKPTAIATVNGRSEQLYNASCPSLCICKLLEPRQWLRFKQWAEKLGSEVIVSDLKCETPEELWKRDFRLIGNDILCPHLYRNTVPTSLSKNSTFPADTGTRPNSYIEPSRVSISVLVPGLLLVFVTSAFTVVGMLVFILRNRKRSKRRDGNSSASEINSLQTVCDSSYWHSGHYHGDASHRDFDCGTHSLSDQ